MMINYKNQDEFDDFTIVEVWRKAIPFKHFELYKKDHLGSIMFFDDYEIKSENGWLLEYIIPIDKCGMKEIDNLRAVHWQNYGKEKS
ncbi:MAG: hypothetical protein WAU11_16845 [Ignavibacteriaceae bacterium]